MTVTQIERIDAPCKEAFKKQYVEPGRPVILTGVSDKWKASSLWTDADYLRKRIGAKKAPVYVYRENATRDISEFGGVAPYRGGTDIKFIRVNEYLDSLEGGERKYYMADVLINRFLPELLEDIEVSDRLHERKSVARQDPTLSFLYFGRDNYTPNHMHMDNHALVCQIVGEKRMKLFSPEQARFLYPPPLIARKANPFISRVAPDDPDLEKYPGFKKATPLECTIQSGEALYIPTFWWHVVYSPGLSMAVTMTNLNHPKWYWKYPYSGFRSFTARKFQLLANLLKWRSDPPIHIKEQQNKATAPAE